VLGLLRTQDRVHGVKAINTRTGEAFEVECQEVINAAGIWGQQICEYADLGIRMFPAKGSLLIMDYRINQLVLNRARKPADADILVPGDTISLIGTTSSRIDYHKIDQLTVEPKRWRCCCARGSSSPPSWPAPDCCAPMPGFARWWRWMATSPAATSAVA
jgi:glycerol-3-phosphate dehydrogenase